MRVALEISKQDMETKLYSAVRKPVKGRQKLVTVTDGANECDDDDLDGGDDGGKWGRRQMVVGGERGEKSPRGLGTGRGRSHVAGRVNEPRSALTTAIPPSSSPSLCGLHYLTLDHLSLK